MSLRDQLQSIYDHYGQLTPALVVEEARHKDHPLHGQVFDRPRKEAADAWYLHRAETLIRSVTVRRTLPNGERVDLRAFSPVRPDQPGVYDPLDKIAGDEVATAVLVATMEREWRSMWARYSHLIEFLGTVRRDLEGAA